MHATAFINRFKLKISSLRNMVLDSISHGALVKCNNCCETTFKQKFKENNNNLKTFENAVKTLNQLQSNFKTIDASLSLSKVHNEESVHIKETTKFLSRINISLHDLDKLSIIHVSGTKGKGSTCALVEKIIRSYGYRTGFFSSPHLVCVTERIRINGKPISRQNFNKFFWDTFDTLSAKKENNQDMPAYFNFLTVLAFEIFLKENVEVVILEVGIGGEYDCTNVVRNTKTIGITSLGLEHTRLLGNTLKEIAWQKAGIIKNNSTVFTIEQPEDCIDVISDRCKEKQATLMIAPNIDTYLWERMPSISCKNLVQKLNASLAIQIALDWLTKKGESAENLLPNNKLSGKIASAIEASFWPGRCQEIIHGNKRLLLDGAHTIESIELCSQWYSKVSNSKSKKVLIFNTTGDRDSKKLLEILHRNHKFDFVLFTPNVETVSNDSANVNYNFPMEQQLQKCEQNLKFWISFDSLARPQIFPSVKRTFEFIENNISKDEQVEILVTGSLHLIGAVMSTLNLSDDNIFK